jgi:hypothetical protein
MFGEPVASARDLQRYKELLLDKQRELLPVQDGAESRVPASGGLEGDLIAVMTEQRPRMQSRPIVVPLRQGDGVVFAVNNRPVQGSRGVYRVNLRHGVSRIISGTRHTVGVIFHDAK